MVVPQLGATPRRLDASRRGETPCQRSLKKYRCIAWAIPRAIGACPSVLLAIDPSKGSETKRVERRRSRSQEAAWRPWRVRLRPHALDGAKSTDEV